MTIHRSASLKFRGLFASFSYLCLASNIKPVFLLFLDDLSLISTDTREEAAGTERERKREKDGHAY